MQNGNGPERKHMKGNIRGKTLAYMAVALAIILFFSFYLIRSDFIAADPFSALPESSLELSDGYAFEIVPTSPRVYGMRLSYMSGSGEGLRLELSDGQGSSGGLICSGIGEFVELIPEGEMILTPGKTYEVRVVLPEGSVLAVAGKDGAPWVNLIYRWIGKGALRLFFAVSASLSAFILWMLVTRKGIRTETVFLLVSLPLCAAFAVVIPALRAPDEVVHFLRAFGIAKGSLIVPPDGMVDLPSNIVPVGFSAPYSEVFSVYSMFRGGDILLSAGNAAYSIQNAALYNPLVYLFCVIGIAAGDFFSDSFYVLITVGRLFNALGCTLMIYLAIRMIPRGKELLCLISLFPINLQERASISADGPSYAAAVLLTAFVLYMRYNREKLDRRRMLQLCAILIFTAACKVVYFAMALLILMIPEECFGSRKKAAFHKAAGILLTTVFALLWVALASRYLGATQGGANGAEKVIYALTHPLWYIKLMAVTSVRRLPGWALQTIAPPMGYFDIPVSKLFAALMGAAAVGIVIRDAVSLNRGGEKRDRAAALVMLGVSFVVLMLIFASLYVQWTPGAPPMIEEIEGIQGRYFLPFLPAALIGITGVPEKKTARSVPARGEGALASCLMAVADIMVIANIFISCSL